MEPIDTIERDGWTAGIYADEDASSPEDWTTVGHLAYRCRRGGAHNANELPHDDYLMGEHLPDDATVILPVRAWDDRNGTELQVADSWDEADGWIYATAASVAETMGEDATDEQVRAALESELGEWVKWAQGDVYGVRVTNPAGDEVDACWGFYGMDYAEGEAKRMLDDAYVPAVVPTLGDVLREQCAVALEAVNAGIAAIESNDAINIHRVTMCEGQLRVAKLTLEGALHEIGPAPR